MCGHTWILSNALTASVILDDRIAIFRVAERWAIKTRDTSSVSGRRWTLLSSPELSALRNARRRATLVSFRKSRGVLTMTRGLEVAKDKSARSNGLNGAHGEVCAHSDGGITTTSC